MMDLFEKIPDSGKLFKVDALRAANTSFRADACVALQDFTDFLKGLKKNSINLALTDPPYTISRKTGFSQVKNGVKRFAVSMEFGEWDKQQIDLTALASGLYRVLVKGGTAIIWYDIWKITELSKALEQEGFKMLRVIVWQKSNPVPLNMKATYLSNTREIAVIGVKHGKPTFHGSYDNGIYEAPIPRHNGKKIHPTQKPLEIFKKLIEKHSNAGDMVIDPFLGSGTTAVAALQLERRFKGCDIVSEYVTQAKARLAVLLCGHPVVADSVGDVQVHG